MSLDDLLASHANGILTDPEGVGELITWRRPAAGVNLEETREVRATVNRLGRTPDERGKETWQAVVFLPRDAGGHGDGVHDQGIIDVRKAAPGVPPDELLFDIQAKGGSDPSWNRVQRINNQDAGGFEVECIR